MRVRTAFVLPALLIAVPAFAASSDLPKRKPGLWQMTIASMGMPGHAIKQCIDEKTDARMQEQAIGNADCSKQEVKRSGNTVVMDSVCKMNGSTMTSHAVVSGDFDKAYVIDSKTRMDPPMAPGMGEMTSKVKAEYLGPCGADMKPGDIAMPNGMKMNVNEMPMVDKR